MFARHIAIPRLGSTDHTRRVDRHQLVYKTRETWRRIGVTTNAMLRPFDSMEISSSSRG